MMPQPLTTMNKEKINSQHKVLRKCSSSSVFNIYAEKRRNILPDRPLTLLRPLLAAHQHSLADGVDIVDYHLIAGAAAFRRPLPPAFGGVNPVFPG